MDGADYDMANLSSLCHGHHQLKTQQAQRDAQRATRPAGH
jgi:hypothetical protein